MKKNINDNTVVRVRVPKKLYEAIQARLNQESMGMPEEGMGHEEEIEEGVDPNLIAGIVGLLGVAGPIGTMLVKNLMAAKTPEEKKAVLDQMKSALDKSTGAGY